MDKNIKASHKLGSGGTFWFTGLSGAGKSTLSCLIKDKIDETTESPSCTQVVLEYLIVLRLLGETRDDGLELSQTSVIWRRETEPNHEKHFNCR